MAILISLGLFMLALESSWSNDLANEDDRVSYTIGYKVAQGFMSLDFEINLKKLKQGLNLVYGKKNKVNKKDIQNYIELASKLNKKDPQKPLTKKEKSRLSYLLGKLIGKRLNQLDYKFLNKRFVKAGALDILSKASIQLTKMQMASALKLLNKKNNQENENQARINQKLGMTFLDKNKKDKKVKETKSGLQYLVLRDSDTDQKPAIRSIVRVHYQGKLLNGEIFDSSYKRGEATVFPLNKVIAGWSEGLQLMNVGSKFRFFIPADLAYGSTGTRGIPPGSLLIFEVELLDIIKK